MKIQVSVRPSSGKSEIESAADGSFIARLKSAPINGKANEELVRLLAKYFHVPQQSVLIQRGARGRKKIVEILGR